MLPGRSTPSDFDEFDLLLAVDEENLHRLRRMLRPEAATGCDCSMTSTFPIPYYGGPDGFDVVLDQIAAACRRLLDELRQG